MFVIYKIFIEACIISKLYETKINKFTYVLF